MAVDSRHLLAGLLTLTMFIMLADMIKRDYPPSPPNHAIHDTNRASAYGLAAPGDDGPSMGDGLSLRPCWQKPVLNDMNESRGYVTFSLTNGPEYHVSQIADAVVVARYLRATLVVPDIRGSTPSDKRNFEDIYSIEKFMANLDGIVKVVTSLPATISARDFAVVKVPNRVTEQHIGERIEQLFRAKGNIRIVTYFPSVNMKRRNEKTNTDSVVCLAMFGTLELQPEVREVVDLMINRLKPVSNAQFVAIDLRLDLLENKSCRDTGLKICYGPKEIALLLRNLGFGKDTIVYVTQTEWRNNLYALKELFPKSYTKESVMPMEKRDKFLNSDTLAFEKVIDYYLCAESDVFVPAISGLFYANVVGKRIASGRNKILVPSNTHSMSAGLEEFESQYVLKRNHVAYSCFC